MSKVIVTRFSSLGDVAMLAVILPEILEQNKDLQILMLSRPKFKYLFPKHDRLQFLGADVDKDYKTLWGLRRLAHKLNEEKPDYFADCHNVLRTQVLRRLVHSKKQSHLDKGRAEKKAMTRRKNKVLHPLESMHERYADVFRKLGFKVELSHKLQSKSAEKKGIGMAPFAFYHEKMLPLEKSKEVALHLANLGNKVMLFGGEDLEKEVLGEWEKEHENITSMAGKFDFKEELKVIEKLQLMISMDSANMHLASLAGTKVLSVWGATHPFLGFLGYGQSLDDCIQIKDLECRPCSVYGNVSCYKKTLECLREIKTEDIIEKARQILD